MKLNVTSGVLTGVKVKDMKDLVPDLKVDWLRVINDHLLRSKMITEEDKIDIESLETFISISKSLASIDERFVSFENENFNILLKFYFLSILADAFVLKFLYDHRPLFILYDNDMLDQKYYLTKKANERWEQCLDYIDRNMDTASEFLFSKSLSRNFEKLQKFVDVVLEDFIDKVNTMDECVLSSEVKKNVVVKLNNTVLFKLDSFDLEDFYKELKLNGTENLVHSALEIWKFRNSIKLKRTGFRQSIKEKLRVAVALLRYKKLCKYYK